MRLMELNKQPDPIFAWLEPATGPERLRGVRLAYIQPLEPTINSYIQNSIDEKKPDRAERLRKDLERYKGRGQKFFTPDYGWWMSKEAFNNGEQGYGGVVKGRILSHNPTIQIVSSREEAIKAAKKVGLI